jgi:hypothetical protein
MNRIDRIFAVALFLSVGITVNTTSAQTLEVDYARYLAEQGEVKATTMGATIEPTIDIGTALVIEKATYTYDFEIAEKYLGGDGAIFHDGALVRNSFTVDFGGYYGNVFLQNGLDDSDFSSNPGDEINYSFGLADDRGAFSYDIGFIYIDAAGLGKMPNGDVYGPYVKLVRVGKIGPFDRSESVKFESYLPGGDIIEGGTLVHVRENVSWSASNGWGLNLSFGPTIDDGAFGFEPGIIGVVKVGVSVPLGKLTLNPGYQISTPVRGAHDRETVRGWSLSTSINF